MNRIGLIITLALAVLPAVQASACPTVDGLIDYNCDGEVRYVFIGDSVVFGRGDSRFGNKGGYVRRLRSRFPNVTMVNLGKPGFTTAQLFRWFKGQFARTSTSTHRSSVNADAIFIDVGRNDFFDDKSAPVTQKNIRRLVDYMRTNLGVELGVQPIITIATLLPTTRGAQQPFIDDVNKELLKRSSSTFPVRLRFDRFPSSIIDIGGVHPRSQGYDRIAITMRNYLEGALVTRSRRTDGDSDGIYDRFESSRFSTSPSLVDTDGDGLADGVEAFSVLSNPTVVDTDGDGVGDGEEVTLGRNPLVAG
jgi:lysophospholipase L1-like esterase